MEDVRIYIETQNGFERELEVEAEPEIGNNSLGVTEAWGIRKVDPDDFVLDGVTLYSAYLVRGKKMRKIKDFKKLKCYDEIIEHAEQYFRDEYNL